MIPPRPAVRHREAWREALAEAITDPQELLAALELDSALLPAARRAARLFGLKVPRPFVDLMQRGDPADPLLRQVLPLDAETRHVAGFGTDPVGDRAAERGPGILHKYHGRALLLATGGCAVNCRYCFRRSYPYADMALTPERLGGAVARLAQLGDFSEIILSGGDPLALPTRRLEDISRGLQELPGLRRLRIHTRTPVVLPQRVDEQLLAWLSGLPWKPVVVLHVNHPREVSDALVSAAARLAATGTTLLNQSVLLAGVNDDAAVLEALSGALFDAGILPYYLHLLDPVAGAAHFHVAEGAARQLHDTLRSRLPGYLVPQLVREEAGAPYKVPITSPFAPDSRC